MEVLGTVNKCVAQNWLRHFKESHTSLEDKPRSGKPVMEDEVLLEMVEQPSTNTCTLLVEMDLHKAPSEAGMLKILQNYWLTKVFFVDTLSIQISSRN